MWQKHVMWHITKSHEFMVFSQAILDVESHLETCECYRQCPNCQKNDILALQILKKQDKKKWGAWTRCVVIFDAGSQNP